MMLPRHITLISSVCLMLVLVSCATAPVTGRNQLVLVSAAEETKLGLTEFDKMKKEVPINRDAQLNAMVQRVGKRIAEVAAGDLPGAQWEFVVFESKEANAFCLPGGKVGVYTGILPITKSEAGLAVVLGHEVAHAAAHHGAERITRSMALQGLGSLLNAGLQSQSPKWSDPKWQQGFQLAYGTGSQVLGELPHSRSQESEADHIGLVYMAKAGYDPAESVKFWERFATVNKASGGATPWFLRTHPIDEDRIKQLQTWQPEAKAAYRPAAK